MHLPQNSSAGWGHPALRGNKNHCAVGAGHCPARDLTAITTLWVTCRGGIYAARRSRPGKSTYRANRTGDTMLAPTTCRKQAFSPITAYVPVICREGSRPLLAVLRLPPISPAGVGSPRPTPHYNKNVRARRALHIYYLLFLIYYLDCPSGAISSPMVHPFAMSREIAKKKQPYFPC